MRAKHRELTEKYKAFRLQPDSLYLSRLIQTFFNKFTKKGKKALARRHLFTALTQFRFTLRHPQMYYALLRIFHRLRIQFLLASKRKGRNLISVPVPVRRNKRDVLNIQTLYKAVTSRRERAAPAAPSFIGQFILMLPLIATLTPLLNFLLMAIFGRLVN
jgi:ribosomal protein S7